MPDLDSLSRDDLIRLILELQRQIEDLRKQNEERVLDQTKKAIETEEIEARVTELERAAGTQNRGGWR